MVASMTQLDPRTRPYRPYGAAERLMYCRDKEVLMDGPAGTGKSRAILEKIHLCLCKYPNARGLIVRKTRASMTESVLVTYEDKVLPLYSPIKTPIQRKMRQAYMYPNGSSLAVAGMDDPGKIMSTEYDIAGAFEWTEGDEDDHEKLTTRLRNGVMPYQQLIADCNPGAPEHWLNQRCEHGQMTRLHSRHEDNPTVTEAYLDTLRRLTGARRAQLYEGLWTQATGLIYDTWSPDNVSEDADYRPDGGPVYWTADDGYSGKQDERTGLYTAESHPRVFLLAQERPNGQLCVFEEHHAIQTLSDHHIADVMHLPYPLPDWVTVDKSAAELKGRLHSEGLYTRNSPSDVEESIKVVIRLLAPDANGWRKILVHPRCKLLISEMSHYRRDDRGKIVKQFDHALDALRYLCWQFRNG